MTYFAFFLFLLLLHNLLVYLGLFLIQILVFHNLLVGSSFTLFLEGITSLCIFHQQHNLLQDSEGIFGVDVGIHSHDLPHA